jgi:hypothetical protein
MTIVVHDINETKPHNGDVCLVHTWGYWSELTWYGEGIGPQGPGFYNDQDIKQSPKHINWFEAPQPFPGTSDWNRG